MRIDPVALQGLISVVTFVASVGSAMFVAGTKWGQMRTDFKVMSDRLSRIEGMFILKLKDHDGA